MLVKYPKDLKLPLVSTHSLAQQSNLLRTDMQSGRARQRKRFQSVPTTMGATWKLNEYQAQILEGFVTHGTNDAVNWFLMPIRTPEGLIEHEVRFKQSPLEACSFNGGFWNYSTNIEIKKRQVVSEETMVNLILTPLTAETFAVSVTNSMNKYLEN
ncbi:hypothetical protein H5087_08855 [Pseudoalteromonas sp. SR43-7]|uniref:hypothetical protein n=1 Tax=Pseudoalteromonas sp. SR43-7 TaxID=2760939 RepID=UPI0015FE132F|nr:hypothetical protein [Pseudoalteromonas sp. SR43-7]MBB1329454.1 hypothetical protein [Pseudoalteromonas sp. SR43-7]